MSARTKSKSKPSSRPYVWTKQEIDVVQPPVEQWAEPPEPKKQTIWLLVRSETQEIVGVVHETRLVTGPKVWRGAAIHATWEKLFLDASDAKRAMLRAFVDAERAETKTVVTPPAVVPPEEEG